jgi:hypothetical protein
MLMTDRREGLPKETVAARTRERAALTDVRYWHLAVMTMLSGDVRFCG